MAATLHCRCVAARAPIKEALKRVVSEKTRMRVRRLGRFRWITKTRGVIEHVGSPWPWLGYILWDPEIDSFTYSIENEDELIAMLAELLGRPHEEISRHVAEVHTDPILRAALHQPWRRWLWTKRQLEPNGWQTALWTIVRVLRPVDVAESGILNGMASTVMLAALERNAREGSSGSLVSVDIIPTAGELVPANLHGRWQKLTGDALAELPRGLEGRTVGLFVSDSLPDTDFVRRELEIALQHRADECVLVVVASAVTAMEEMGFHVRRFQEKPHKHFYRGGEISFARV